MDTITQAEGGEQGDPPTPALFSLGSPGTSGLQAQLQEDQRLCAFLDDVHVVSLLQNALFIHSAIFTMVWNRGDVVPSGMEVMEAVARITDPEAIVWRGDTACRVWTKACGFWAHPWGTQTTSAHSWHLCLRHTTS